MVLSFFRKGDPSIEHIRGRIVSMIGDARHSFDLATSAVLAGADPASVADDIRETDRRINQAEQELRGELVVHVSVQGPDDIGTVLAYTLLIKKIERIGDQAKNILDLAEEGVSLADQPDIEEFQARRQEISTLFALVTELLTDPESEGAHEFIERSREIRLACEMQVRELLHSDEPGHIAVPRAILYRYWKRIVANLSGIVTTFTEPLQHADYEDSGQTDITDD